MPLRCEKGQVFRKLTLDEVCRFPENIKGEDKINTWKMLKFNIHGHMGFSCSILHV